MAQFNIFGVQPNYQSKFYWNYDEPQYKSNYTMKDILDDEYIIDEMRSQNPKLLDFFTQNKQNILELLQYALEDPSTFENKKRAYLYPFTASSIFEAEIPCIINAFFSDLKIEKNELENNKGFLTKRR